MNNSVKIIRRTLFLAGCFLAGQLHASVNAEPAAVAAAEQAPVPVVISVEEVMEKASTSTADHSKFEELDKDFKTGIEVTEACLGCHTE